MGEAIGGQEFSFEEFTHAILDAALNSAQGNAGVIYTGFLAGFLPALGNFPVDSAVFGKAMGQGAARARQSVQNPKEGTMLDAIAASAGVAADFEKGDIVDVLRLALDRTRAAVAATKEKMEILRRADVVDAGALGFAIILESYLEALGSSAAAPAVFEPRRGGAKKFIQVIGRRYEVASLVRISGDAPAAENRAKEILGGLGDCLDIVYVGQKMKVHIHTDDPEAVKKAVSGLGCVKKQYVQDLTKGVGGRESQPEKRQTAIIIDSAADIPICAVESYGMEVVDFSAFWPDGKVVAGENIFARMRRNKAAATCGTIKTSQPSPKKYLDAYRRGLQKAEGVVCVCLSSELSGAYNAALQAQKMLSPGEQKRVFAIDSRNASVGEGLVVLAAADFSAKNMAAAQTISILKKTIASTRLFGMVDDPKWLEEGGRLSHSAANWVRFMPSIGIRPFLTIKKGLIKAGGVMFGAKDIPNAIFRGIAKQSAREIARSKKIRVAICHGDNADGARRLEELIKKHFKESAEISFINIAGPVIGAHIGPGSLICAWQPLEN